MELHEGRHYNAKRKEKTILCIDVSALKDVVDAFADFQTISINPIQSAESLHSHVLYKKR